MPNSLDSLAGKLTFKVSLDSCNIVTDVVINNSRPRSIGRFFIGQTESQLLQTIPKLFLLCSQAQQAAALSALHAEKQVPMSQHLQEHYAHRCSLEWLKEHCWQLWQMGRELFGDNFALKENVALQRFLRQQIQQAECDSQSVAQPEIYQSIVEQLTPLYGISPQQFYTFDWQQLAQWSQQGSAFSQLFDQLKQPSVRSLGAFPCWNTTLEDGYLTRRLKHHNVNQAMALWGNGVATRLLARLIEIAEVCADPYITASQIPGQAFTSRGSLQHKIAFNSDETIKDYLIDSPTDRWFSPNGLAYLSLLNQTIANRDTKWIRQLIWAIDPCVEFTVEIIPTATE